MEDSEILKNLELYQNRVANILNSNIEEKPKQVIISNTSSSPLINKFPNIFFFFIFLGCTVIMTTILYKLEPEIVLDEKQISYVNGVKEKQVNIFFCILYGVIISGCLTGGYFFYNSYLKK